MCATAKPESVFAVVHASCRIAPFRRCHVSEVCQCGGIVLAFLSAFAAPRKRRSNQSPVTVKIVGANVKAGAGFTASSMRCATSGVLELHGDEIGCGHAVAGLDSVHQVARLNRFPA
jgi:hypothetical protein